MTKLMTTVAVLQCVEQGLLKLDDNIRPIFPTMGKYGILDGFDDAQKVAKFKPDDTPITLRMLLTHTSGHEYDWFSPPLLKWRASRNEMPWIGSTVQDKSSLPLVFQPGMGFAYGTGNDWAGKAVEAVASCNLEVYMRTNIWAPLGIERDVSFHPKTMSGMDGRVATLTSLSDNFEGPAKDEPNFDALFASDDCFGGGGAYATTRAYYTFLSAVFRRDSRLLTPESYIELFRPQLDERGEKAMNDYINSTPTYKQYLGFSVPPTVRKNYCLAGMSCAAAGQDGSFDKGTTMWGGFACCKWFMDHDAGVCGVALCQVLPAMSPPIMALHDKFQREIVAMVGRK